MYEEKYEIKLTPQEKDVFCVKMYEALKKNRITVGKMAEKIGYEPNTIYKFVSNDKPSKKLAASIDKFIHELEGEKENGE